MSAGVELTIAEATTVWCSAAVVKMTARTAILTSHGRKSKFPDHSALRLCIKEGPTIADMRGSQYNTGEGGIAVDYFDDDNDVN